MKYQGVIFDFNGTLFFDSHYHDLVWKQIAKELRGYELSDAELQREVHGKNNEKIIDALSVAPLSRTENKRISLEKEAKYRAMVKEHPETSVLAPGAIAFFEKLKQHHIPFTIASASIKENVDFYVSYFHLSSWIDPKTIVYDDGSYENKIGMFQDAAKNIGTKIEECLVFEDSHSGIQFAHAAHAKGIIVIDAHRDPQRYLDFPYVNGIYPDFTNLPISEILDIIK